jgi:hypothetical protein
MVNILDIKCSSALHDASGIVFFHGNDIYRGLSKRGRFMLDYMHDNFDFDELEERGFSIPQLESFNIDGFYGIAKMTKQVPFLGPDMWSFETLVNAFLKLCKLNQALLKKNLVIWDLGDRDCMSIDSKMRPSLTDFGAIHTVEEIYSRKLSTSYRSLVSQLFFSFVIPIWLGANLGRSRFTRRFLNEMRINGRSSFAKSVIEFSTLRGKILPQYLKSLYLARKGDLHGLYQNLHEWAFQLKIRTTQNPIFTPANIYPMRIVKLEQAVSILFDLGVSSVRKIADIDANLEHNDLVNIDSSINVYGLSNRLQWPWVFQKNKETEDANAIDLVVDLWNRNSNQINSIKGSFDTAICRWDLYEYLQYNRISLEFFANTMSKLSEKYLIVFNYNKLSDQNTCDKTVVPGFTAPPANISSYIFLTKVIGRYFPWHHPFEIENKDVNCLVFGKTKPSL